MLASLWLCSGGNEQWWGKKWSRRFVSDFKQARSARRKFMTFGRLTLTSHARAHTHTHTNPISNLDFDAAAKKSHCLTLDSRWRWWRGERGNRARNRVKAGGVEARGCCVSDKTPQAALMKSLSWRWWDCLWNGLLTGGAAGWCCMQAN